MKKTAIALLALTLCLGSCNDSLGGLGSGHSETYYINTFASNVMQTYYLWKEEVQIQLNTWRVDDDPKEKVASARYRQDGKLVDRWTQLTDDYDGFLGSVNGNETSFGMEFQPYYADADSVNVNVWVTFTYADSPARKAGLKRGDVIVSLDGQGLNVDNYKQVLTDKILHPSSVDLELQDGRHVQMTAVQLVEDPVHTVAILEHGGKKLGYLHFASFTQDCCKDLENVFRGFKEAGIRELVLDLRYNGGGYTTTSATLASMIAPPQAVKDSAIFNREVYNAQLSKEMEGVTCFAPEHNVPTSNGKELIHALEANPGVERVWVIQTGNTASASEALVCGLKPYFPDNRLTLVGSTSYGKFCGGFIMGSANWYNALSTSDKLRINAEEGARLSANWGIYVMVSRYADREGVTLSMPSGIPADVAVRDNPCDGFDLGQSGETMLAAVLALSAGEPLPGAKASVAADGCLPGVAADGCSHAGLRRPEAAAPAPLEPLRRPSFGVRVLTPGSED